MDDETEVLIATNMEEVGSLEEPIALLQVEAVASIPLPEYFHWST
jgi:hypothetical protein